MSPTRSPSSAPSSAALRRSAAAITTLSPRKCADFGTWHQAARWVPSNSVNQAPAPRYRTTFLRLLGFLRPYKGSMIVSIVLAIGSQAAALVAILLTRSVVAALHHNELHRLPWLVVVVVALGVARALMMSGRRLIAGKQALLVEHGHAHGDLREARPALVRLLRPPPDRAS